MTEIGRRAWGGLGLKHRERLDETMDDPGLALRQHFHALSGLARLNRLSRTAEIFAGELRRFSSPAGSSPLRILDLACGGGDITIGLAKLVHRLPGDFVIDGCDLSPRAVRYAEQQQKRSGVACRFFVLDLVRDPLPDDYDVFVTSLFLHHLSEVQLTGLLKRMARAARSGFLVNDLRRSAVGYLLAGLSARLVTRSPVVHRDSLLSVRAAFRFQELEDLVKRAGLTDARLRRCFPCRFLLSWRKDPGHVR